MPEPGSTQKKPVLSGASVTDAAANPVESGSNPESSTNKEDTAQPRELGGPAGLEPTRYGDWERKGRCIDF
jgi:hypothetical protein